MLLLESFFYTYLMFNITHVVKLYALTTPTKATTPFHSVHSSHISFLNHQKALPNQLEGFSKMLHHIIINHLAMEAYNPQEHRDNTCPKMLLATWNIHTIGTYLTVPQIHHLTHNDLMQILFVYNKSLKKNWICQNI